MNKLVFTSIFLLRLVFSSYSQNSCISYSLRFNDNDNAYLNRTFNAGNRKVWTFSAWVKRANLTTTNAQALFSNYTAEPNGRDETGILFTNDDKLQFRFVQLSGGMGLDIGNHVSKAVYRDPASWYHIVVSVNTPAPIASDRLKMYVNGVEITDWDLSTTIAQNADTYINQAVNHTIGEFLYGGVTSDYPYDGYMSDVYFIDGQALAATSFGQIDPISGAWKPFPYSGGYGTTGFYLNFKDASPAADLGKDVSGNNNHWTINNHAASDQVLDVPKNNFAVLNYLVKQSTVSLADGNLYTSNGNDNKFYPRPATIALPSTGKWYFEASPLSFNGGARLGIGIIAQNASIPNTQQRNSGGYGMIASYQNEIGYFQNGEIRKSNVVTQNTTTYTVNDVLGCAYDAGAATVTFYKNGVQVGIPETFVLTGVGSVFFAVDFDGTGTVNFGQGGQNGLNYYPGSGGYFKYAPPCDFKTLSTQYLPAQPIIKGADYFAAAAYTGNNGANSVSSLNFQPDVVLLKDRTALNNWGWFDGVRGVTNYLSGNNTLAEVTNASSLTAFNSNGFSINNAAAFNINANNYVSYNWKTDNSPGTANTNGSIASTVSVNTTSEMSTVTYTGTGANATIGHGLLSAPEMMIVKKRNGAGNWAVFHNDMNASPQNGYMLLNSTGTFASDNTYWNNTAPANTVFSVGTNADVNAAGDNYVAYLFSEVEGFSEIGAYTGNGDNDGPFVWCGFTPAFVMVKNVETSDHWVVFDNARPGYNDNVVGRLYADGNDAEAQRNIDLVSNGFKLRNTDPDENNNDDKYIFVAFAKYPFKYYTGEPSTCTYAPPRDTVIACDSAQVYGNWYYASQTVIDTLTSSYGCDSVVITDLTIYNSITAVNVTQTNVSCNGDNDGSATLAPVGGTGPYSYIWFPFVSFSATANNLTAGTYTVFVTDANACNTFIKTVTITQPNVLTVNAASSVTHVSCFGGNDGSATALPAGGTAPYTYSWSSGGTAAVESGLTMGTYTVTVTDTNSCMAIGTVTINQPTALSVGISSSVDVSCFGGTNGQATAAGSGGVAPYTYSWSSGGNQAAEDSLAASTYTVTVTDSNSCTATQTVIIAEPADISITLNSTPATCNGSTGDASAVVSGGTAPYSYAWSSGGNLFTEDSLALGTYTITVTDSLGCVKADSVTVTSVNDSLYVAFSWTPAVCTSNTGDATASPSGGTAPYSYSWSTGGSGATEDSLAAGTYTLTVTDMNGCFVVDSVTVTDSSSILQITFTTTTAICLSNTGSATATVTGGLQPYTYAWSSGDSLAFADSLFSGFNTLVVTDSNGCVYEDSVNVPSIDPMSLNITTTPNSCSGNDGTATATPVNGTGPYIFLWQIFPFFQTDSIATGLSAGTYTVNVVDFNGCLEIETVTVSQASAPTAVVSNVSPAICGSSTGSATVVASGGTAPYTYSWSTGATTAMADNLPAGVYTVTVTDSIGCTVVANPVITASGSSVTAAFTTDTTSGEVPLTITFTNTSSGSPFYSYWQFGNGDTTSVANPVYTFDSVDTFTVCLIAGDTLGCADTACTDVMTSLSSILIIPNVFSPNGDGNNDVFLLKPIGLTKLDAEIYNRWGQKIYEWHMPNAGWNGTTSGGGTAPDGTYYYIIHATNIDGKEFTEKGYVFLVR